MLILPPRIYVLIAFTLRKIKQGVCVCVLHKFRQHWRTKSDVLFLKSERALTLGSCDRASWAKYEDRKTNKMQQLDVYY